MLVAVRDRTPSCSVRARVLFLSQPGAKAGVFGQIDLVQPSPKHMFVNLIGLG